MTTAGHCKKKSNVSDASEGEGLDGRCMCMLENGARSVVRVVLREAAIRFKIVRLLGTLWRLAFSLLS